MSVIYLELAGLNIKDTPDTFQSGNWDGYPPSQIPQAFQVSPTAGYGGTWGGIQDVNVPQFTMIPYTGYDTNFGATSEAFVAAFKTIPYSGYNTNFAGTSYINVSEFPTTDIDSVIEYPKTQFVYFKLKGYNPITQNYENWIIKEDITSRPELFDPGRNPPSVDKDVYRKPPSGDALVNITIVARWIQ